MQPIGGYFSLEVNDGWGYHHDALRLNSGRYALEYILKARKYRKIYLPYYICDSVLQPIKRQGVKYEFYHINKKFEPADKIEPNDDAAVLYVNYFGLKNNFASSFCYRYHNTILDQTQAFYSENGNKYNDSKINCDTFYSCRKYFGVPDGAYLYTNCLLEEELPVDESYDRMTFLTKRIDRSPQEAYEDFHSNDQLLATVGLRRMSRLTESIMQGIDFSAKANKRIHNFYYLDKALHETNRLKWAISYGTVPMVYPYYIEDGERLRQHLIDNQIFCARYWPNVLDWCKPEDFEYQLAKNLVCIPLDQRYGEKEMEYILKKISECIN